MDSSRKERRSNRQQLFLEQQQKDYDHEDRMPKQVYTQLIIGLDKEQCTTPSRRKTVHLDNSSVASGSTGNTSYPIGTPPRSAGANGGRSSRTVASDNARHRSQRSRSFTREDERKMSSSSRSDYSSRNRSERVISADVPRSRRRSRSPSGRSDIVVSQSTGMYSAQTTKRGGQQHAQSAKITTPSPSNFNNNNNRHNYGGGGASDQISAGSFGANFSSFDFRDTPPSVYKDKTESLASTVNRSSFRSGSDRDESTKELLKLHAKMSRKVVDELNRAHVSMERRIPSVTNACAVFDHDDENKHNLELYYGAAMALNKLLTVSTHDDEIRMIFSALEMVCRGSPKQLNIAFLKISHSFLSNLLKFLERFETKGVRHADLSILNISKIFYYLSRSSELRPMLCRSKAMLQALARVSKKALNTDSRLFRVRTIANLANCDENKVLLYEQEGIVDSLLRAGHFDSSDLVRQFAITALMEFSSSPSNQVSMANNEVLIGTLVKVVLVEDNPVTREGAITTLQSLAFIRENRQTLVMMKGGIVLEALKKALASNNDTKTRGRAAGALTNLACEETSTTMAKHKDLVTSLAISASNDVSDDVQARASLALTKIASNATVEMDFLDMLLDALVVASLSKAKNTVAAVFRMKSRIPEYREPLAKHSGVVDTLCDIVISDGSITTDRDNAVRAIMHLVNEDKNRKILCNSTVLDALVTAANYTETELEGARDSSILALERLATDVTNRHTMAHHLGLLVTVAKSVEREAIWILEGREYESDYLAKPLLLSLLVAM